VTISTITQTISTFPTAPSRDQDQTTFTTNAENHVIALSTNVTEQNSLKDQLNTVISEINTDTSDIASQVTSAEDAATSAAASATTASSTASNNGAWSALTGSLAAGQAVNHSDSVWVSNVSIADVTLSEPSEANSDWTEVSATANVQWEPAVITTETLTENTQVNIFATSTAVDATLPLPVVGDYLVVANDILSTQVVRFIVSGSVQLIALNGTTYTATSNITMEAGESVYLTCTKTAGTWEQK